MALNTEDELPLKGWKIVTHGPRAENACKNQTYLLVFNLLVFYFFRRHTVARYINPKQVLMFMEIWYTDG